MTELLVRAYRSEVHQLDPETLDARLVPYGVQADVAELTPDGVRSFVEEFEAGAFDRQVTSPEPGVVRRINLLDEHEGGSGKVGVATMLVEKADGLHGRFRLLPTRAADVAALLDAGIGDVSIGFVPLKGGTYQRGNVTVRSRAHLVHVALEAVGAYPGAEVLAMREAADIEVVEAEAEAERRQAAADLDAWLEAERAKQAALLERHALGG